MAVQVPPKVFIMNYRAAEDAKFWMGVCQLEQNMFEPASETLDAYWRRYLEGGKWIPQAGLLRGLALARLGKYALAVQQINELLRMLPEDEPRRYTCELFAARWRAARDAANSASAVTPKEEQPAPKSAPKSEPTSAPQTQPPTSAASAPPAAAGSKLSPASSPPATTAPSAKAASSSNTKAKTP